MTVLLAVVILAYDRTAGKLMAVVILAYDRTAGKYDRTAGRGILAY